MKKWISSFLKSFVYAFTGIFEALRRQRNLRFDFLIGIIVLIVCSFLPLSSGELLWVVFSIVLVIVFELLNSLLEELMDLLYPYFNEKVRIVKDLAAGIVLVAAVFTVVVGLIVVLRHLFGIDKIIGIFFLMFFLTVVFVFSKKGGKDEKNKSDDM